MSVPLDIVFSREENCKEQPGNTGRALVVISEPFAPMKNEIRKSLAGQADIEIVVDRRKAERRSGKSWDGPDRRRESRRKPKANVLQVILDP
ncbi:MAG: hypothetical protein K9K64_07315 [Desulfohalobiaceae bacterium]|nr:hypothetical protein [Desulfohalobiaceae bacterium]